MKKTLCIILAVMLIAVSLCACGNENRIIGSWSGTTDGIPITMTFDKDGSGIMSFSDSFSANAFTYKIEGSTITAIAVDGSAIIFKYSIDGDTLTLTTDGEIMTLTKVK